MGQLIHQPQDKLFKQSLTDIRVARDFFEAHLPSSILNAVDLNTLKLEKSTFISPEYKSSEADILYRKVRRFYGLFLLTDGAAERR